MSSDRAPLGVVVVNYGTHRLLAANLADLTRHTPDARVVVVDNYSTLAERAAMIALANDQGWRTVLTETNLGFGGGMNLGAKAALADGAETLLLLNPDASIDADSLRILRDQVERDGMSLVSPRVIRPDGSVWFAGNDLYLTDGHMQATRRRNPGMQPTQVVPWLSGACLMVRRGLWEKLGGFDEDYFMYWEDVDLSCRASRIGARLLVEDKAVVIHDEGGSQDTGSGPAAKSDLYYYYNIRNRLLFAGRHLDPPTRRAWRRRSVQAMYQILLRGGRRQLLSARGPLCVGIRATRDGLRLSGRGSGSEASPLVVMLSFPPPLATSNPYNMMLANSLRLVPEVVVKNFSWREALTGRYDVFHAHWPEILVTGTSPMKKLAKQGLFLVLITKLRLTGTPWVRTVHNLDLPRGITRRERLLLRLADRWTTLRITINHSTTVPLGQAAETILHGDYTNWYSKHLSSEQVAGRILYFGTIRRYKGVPGLVRAFREIKDPALSLHVAGRLSNPDYERELRTLAAGDERVSLSFAFLPEEILVREVGEASLVVLPYPEMHNSGSALAALSLRRSVLVPRNEVNQALSDEVGTGWVHMYEGTLAGEDILRGLDAVQAQPDAAGPDFSARDWTIGGQKHVAAYRRAIQMKANTAWDHQRPARSASRVLAR